MALADVRTFRKMLGGSPTNVAVAAARLGRRCGGRDDGRRRPVRRLRPQRASRFRRRRVARRDAPDAADAARVLRDPPARPTSRCSSTASRRRPTSSWSSTPTAARLDVPLLWTTGTGLSQEPSRSRTLAALAARAGVAAAPCIDLDYRAMFWASAEQAGRWNREALAHATVAVGNAEEVAVVAGRAARAREPRPSGSLDARASSCDREAGRAAACSARPARSTVLVPPVEVEVVNGLGAGDAFGGALCHGLLAEWPLERTLRFANAAGALVAGAARLRRRHADRRRGGGSCARPDEDGARPGPHGADRAAGAARRRPATSRCASSAPASAAPTCTSRRASTRRVVPVTVGHEVAGEVAETGEGVDGELARRARRQRDVLLDVRPLRVLPRRAHEPLPRAALDRHARRRRLRAAARRAGDEPAPHPRLARRPRGRDDRAARVRLPLAAGAERAARRRRGARDRARARSACSPRRSRARPAASVHVRGTPRDEARLEAAARLGFMTSTTDDGPLRGRRRRRVLGPRGGHGVRPRVGAARRPLRAIGLAGKPVTIPFDLVCFHELTVTSGFASTPSSWRRGARPARAAARSTSSRCSPRSCRWSAGQRGVRGHPRRRGHQVRARPELTSFRWRPSVPTTRPISGACSRSGATARSTSTTRCRSSPRRARSRSSPTSRARSRGVALGVLAGTEGRIVDLTTVSGDGEVADDLLDALEQALANHGAHTVASLVGPGELRTRLEGRGYGPADGAVYLQRAAAAQRRGAGDARPARRAHDRPGPLGRRCAASRTPSGSSSGA